ncbi:Glutaredoxin [Trinorchestia longiramus]|nr:Glutaredoxin [Trinorchestia longiramus]
MGVQAGFTKYCGFLCLWDSQAVSKHYQQKDWGSRSTFVPGEHSVLENPLVDMKKVFLSLLQLSLTNNFMKAMVKNGAAYQHLCTLLPALSSAKLKEGIFVRPQIRQMLKDKDFEELLTLKELKAWEAFKSICHGVLLGRLVSESACERKDPGSNPAADMVDAARNTAWDLEIGVGVGAPLRPALPELTHRAYFHPASKTDKPKKSFFKRLSFEVKLAAGFGLAIISYYLYDEYQKRPQKQKIAIERRGESHFLKDKPQETRIAKSIVNPKDNSGLKLTLYQYQTCPFCCKVRAFLDYHGFSYDVVEVNSVTRAQTRWTEYKKVPFLLVEIPAAEYGESTILQLKDSTVIISILASVLRNPKDSLLTIIEGYPSFYNEDNKLEFSNRYRIMYGENYAEVLKNPKESATELQWRQWVGNWEELFSTWERLLVVYVGAAAMYFIGKRLKKRHKLEEEPRVSLYKEAKQWMKLIKSSGGKFAGGNAPNLADISMYGMLTAIEGCDAFADLKANTNINVWYSDMKDRVLRREGEQALISRCTIR